MIKTIELRNFKCFEEEHIALGPMTLATGLNGTGKSSLIQSLLLLRQSHLQGLLRSGLLAINGELVQLGTGRDALNEAAEEDVIALALSWTDGLSARWEFAYDKTADVLSKRTASAPSEVFERPPMGGDFHYLSAERLGPRASFGMSDHSVGHLREIGARGEYASYFLSLFGRDRVTLEGLLHPEAASGTLIDQVEAWLGEVSPGARLHVKAHRAVDAVELRFSFAGPHGNTNEYRATRARVLQGGARGSRRLQERRSSVAAGREAAHADAGVLCRLERRADRAGLTPLEVHAGERRDHEEVR